MKTIFSKLILMAAIAAAPVSAETPHDRFTLGDSFLSDFYVTDSELQSAPGLLVRAEALDERQRLEYGGTQVRLLYTATDGLEEGGITTVSGALFLPKGNPPDGGWPLMAWTHGTVGIADRCAPSWNGRQSQDEDYLNRYLARGYAVVASDYQGLGTKGTHPYLHTRAAAYSNLDIIKAVQGADFPLSKKVVLFGQSQGAAAAIATGGYAPYYAPEIQLVGVVATGAPYFTPAALNALDRLNVVDRPDPLLGYTFLVMTLAEQVDPSFNMFDYLTDYARPIAQRADDLCYASLKKEVINSALSRRNSFKKNPRVGLKKAFNAMGYPHLNLPVPLFFGTGGKDNDTPPRMQKALKIALCEAGTTVQSQFYPDLDHRGVVLPSTSDSLPFVGALFAGQGVAGNCEQI